MNAEYFKFQGFVLFEIENDFCSFLREKIICKDKIESDFSDKAVIQSQSLSIQDNIEQRKDDFQIKNELKPVLEGQKTYVCEICKDSFKTKYGLRRHEGRKRHIGCNICKMVFNGTKNLKDHINQGYVYLVGQYDTSIQQRFNPIKNHWRGMLSLDIFQVLKNGTP